MAKRVLRNVEFKWCKFANKDDYGNYSCKVILSPENVDILEGWGVNVREDEDGKFIQARRNKDAQGNELDPPKVVDGDMNPVDSSIIGNGSKGNVRLDVYEYKAYGGGVAARLDSVQILELIPYGDDESFEAQEEGGEESNDSPF